MTAEAKLQSFELLLAEISAALAETLELSRQKTGATEEVSASLSELVDAIQSHAKADPSVIADAIKSLRFEAPKTTVENTVNVQPTPIENRIEVQPAAVENHNHITVQPHPVERPAEFEISGVLYDNQSRITGARIRVVRPTGKGAA